MSKEKNTTNKKGNKIDIDFLSKETTNFIDKYQKQNFNTYTLNDNIKMSIYEEEDSYDSWVYDKSISKDNLFFNERNKHIIFYNTISSYKCFNSIKDRFNKKNKNVFFDDNNLIELKKNKNFSFGERKDDILLNEDINNKKENCENLRENINIFSSLHKKFKYLDKNKDIDLIKSDDNNKNINIKKSKFSRKKEKKESNNNEKDKHLIQDRKTTEIVVDSSQSNNKILKIDNISNTNSKIDKNIINKISNKVNFKLCDAYIISSDFEQNLTEKDKEVIFKDKKPMRKINVSFAQNILEEKLNINKPKINSHSIANSISVFNNKNNNNIKTSINNYKEGDNNKYSNSINNSKKKVEFNMNKIITKRVILEEEYMVSPKGEKKLLSVKRLEENNNDFNNPFKIIQKDFKSEKIINKNKPLNNRNSLNNSLFSSIFREKSKQKLYNRTILKSIDEDSLILSDISSRENNGKSENGKSSISNHKNIKISNQILKKANLGKEKSHEQNNKSELNSKDLNLKKDLFYNKLCLIKDKNINNFNKICYNNNSTKNKDSNINHTNYVNNNISSINYIEDKEKYNLDSNKSIYDKISFTNEQPFMIYHKEQPKPNLIINNNQNCPNLVNIVFYNQEEKNNKNNKNNMGKNKYFHINNLNIRKSKNSNLLKRSNYRFHEIKSISTGNYPGSKSSRNYLNNESHKFLNKNNINSYYELEKNNNKINVYAYSSMDNLNKKK